MQDALDSESNRVSPVLPWVVAAGALLLYLFTLHHWVSLASLPFVAKVAGWDWVLPHQAPLRFLLTYPFRWFPTGVQPLALNAFMAVCAALSLALLARSVMLLPHDRTHDQRQRERSEFSLLSIRAAWLPPLFAVLVCGLELTFWEHASVATGEMLDLLLFAYVIRCLLEYRIDERGEWLSKLAFVYGLGVANNWAMIGFFPCFLLALVWIKGLDFFRFDFLLRMLLLGLAGLSLYLLLPLAWNLSQNPDVKFWDALRANLAQQKAMLFDIPALRSRVLLLSLTSLVPAFLIGIRWRTTSGDTSAAGTLLTSLMLRAIHVILLVACLWVAFDQKFSPRLLGLGLPFLTFYYLGALSVGYFSGYLLLVFGEHRNRGRRHASGSTEMLDLVLIASVWLAAVGVPAALVYKNFRQIREQNAPVLRQLAETCAQGLPAQGGIILSDDLYSLLMIEGHLSSLGERNKHLLLHTSSLTIPNYHWQLSKRYPQRWPAALGRGDEPFDDGTLLRMLTDMARTNGIYYLHPSFGYYFERFFIRPHGLVSEMVLYPTNVAGAMRLKTEDLASNQAFWAKAEGTIAALRPSHNALDAVYAQRFFSRALNAWGVTLQRNGQFDGAAKVFETATELSTNNIPAYVNLEFNRARRTGTGLAVLNPGKLQERFGPYRIRDALAEGGPFDEPEFCFSIGETFMQNSLSRQALIEFQRAYELDTNNILAEIGVANVHLHGGRPAEAIAWVQAVRTRRANMLTESLRVDLARLEANAEYARTNVAAAEKILLSAQTQHPKHLGILDNLVHLYTRERRYADALATLDKLDKLAPSNAQVPMNRATVYFNSKDFDKSLATLDQILQRDPKNLAALNYKAFVLVQMRKHAEALPVTENVLRLEPENLEALNLKGVIAIELKKYAEAITDLTHVLKTQPNDWNALRNRAIAHLQLGNLRKAKQDYSRLLQVAPAYYVAYYGLGEIAYREKETSEAIKFYERYLKYFPPDGTSDLEAEKKQVTERLNELKKAPR